MVTTYGFATAPIAEPRTSESGSMPLAELLRSGRFWLLIGVMVFAGASENSISQWMSLFAEQGLGIGKLAGDLLGPSLFALCMALVRVSYGKWESKFPLEKFLAWGAVACVACYLTAALSRSPAVALAACALCGVTVALMWPGVLHSSAKRIPRGGTGLFGMLALGGDLGCSLGPWSLGLIGDRRGLRGGLLAGAVFPVGFLALFVLSGKLSKKEPKQR